MNKNFKNKLLFVNTQVSTNNEFNNLNRFISIYDNIIIINKDDERKPTETIGIYNIVEFNVRLGLNLGVNPFDFVKNDSELFLEFNELVVNNINTINEKYDKVLFINNLLLKDEYKGQDLMKELMIHLYRTLFNERILLVFLVKPIQYLNFTFFIYRTLKKIIIKTKFNDIDIKQVDVNSYFNLDKLNEKYKNCDEELQLFKLYSSVQSCGLKMFDTEHLFYMSENNMLKLINNE